MKSSPSEIAAYCIAVWISSFLIYGMVWELIDRMPINKRPSFYSMSPNADVFWNVTLLLVLVMFFNIGK